MDMDAELFFKIQADYVRVLDENTAIYERYLDLLTKYNIIMKMEERLASVKDEVRSRRYHISVKKQVMNASKLLDSEDSEESSTYTKKVLKEFLRDTQVSFDFEALDQRALETEEAEGLVEISELITEAGHLAIAVAALQKDFDESYAQVYATE